MKNKFLLIISLITNHLGMNPIKGGNPPNEKKFMIREILIFLFKFKEIGTCFR